MRRTDMCCSAVKGTDFRPQTLADNISVVHNIFLIIYCACEFIDSPCKD